MLKIQFDVFYEQEINMIKLLKLVTEELIIADVEADTGIFKLSNPIMLVMGEGGVAMIPYCPFTDEKVIEISYKHIMFETNPNEQAANAYKEQFGGIVTAPAIALDQLGT